MTTASTDCIAVINAGSSSIKFSVRILPGLAGVRLSRFQLRTPADRQHRLRRRWLEHHRLNLSLNLQRIMKVILSGLHSNACKAVIIESFAPFFHIRQVKMIREGSPDKPWAVLHIADSYERAWEACNTLGGVFHRGKRLHMYIPLHQPDIYHEFAPHQRVDIR